MSSLSRRDFLPLLVGSLGLTLGGQGCTAPRTREAPAHPEVDAALTWLLANQRSDGAFPSSTYGLLASGESLTPAVLLALIDITPFTSLKLDVAIHTGLDFLSTRTDSSGAIGLSGAIPDYPVYATSQTILAAARSGRPQQLTRFGSSIDWLVGQQLTRARGWQDSPALGGWPMGGRRVPSPPHPGHVDLSMTRRALQALRATGTLDDDARSDAQAFVSGSETDGGGFIYSKVNPGLNKAGPITGYGSATCDGLLALTALGRSAADPQVQRGLAFLRSIHRSDRNPGLAGGPFAAFAGAMKGYYRAASAAVFARWGWPAGRAEEMIFAVLAEQQSGGFWQSKDVLQKEDDPLIATAFALQALAGALPAATHSR